MIRNENAPALGKQRKGVECLLGGDIDAHTTIATRVQFLNRLGIPSHRAGLIARHCFGEAA